MRMKSFFLTLGVLVGLASPLLPRAHGQFTGVLMQHNDLARSGQNLHETTLTPANVTQTKFGKLFSYAVDGQIYAQPLYVPNVNIAGGKHNVLIVATENDSVYAFDADGLSPTVLWQVSFVNPAAGIAPAECAVSGGCNVYPIVGVTATPVIDIASKTIYVHAKTGVTSGGTTTYLHSLHALDLFTGKEKFNGPVTISGSVPGTGTGSRRGVVAFDPIHDSARAGLVEANGNIYVSLGGSQHGWLFSFNATTLAQTGILNTTPNGTLGSIWQSGNGLAVDSAGNLFFATGDGTFDANTGGVDYGDTVMKLSPTLQVLDYFTPMDQNCRFTPVPNNDLDLGSGGPMILPTQSGGFPDEIVEAGKGGTPCDLFGGNYAVPIYLLNRDGLGGYNPAQDQDIQTVAGTVMGYWSNPAFFQGPSASYVYYSGQTNEAGGGDYLEQFTLTNGALSTAPVALSTNLFPVGSTPSISANGTSNGILWAIERKDILASAPGNHTATLYAYDATNVATMLYNSGQQQSRDATGCGNKMQQATIAKGKVYVGTQNEVDVFGLLSANPTTPAPSISVPCFTFTATVGTTSAAQATKLTNLGPGNLVISAMSFQGLNGNEFGQTNTCGASLPYTLVPKATCNISISFSPAVKGTANGYLLINDNAIGGGMSLQVIGTGK
ncbi:MAG: hypothetical protein WB510_11530 [Candidatus Sulfotelmatobacter sp.]